jgi:hypothetical protein
MPPPLDVSVSLWVSFQKICTQIRMRAMAEPQLVTIRTAYPSTETAQDNYCMHGVDYLVKPLNTL